MSEFGFTMFALGAASGALIVGAIWLFVESMKLQRQIKQILKNERLG